MKYITLFLCLIAVAFSQPALAENKKISPEKRLALVKKVKNKDKIIYRAKNEKYKVRVFTDISCPYCSKFHKQVKAMNRAGITVEYLAFPRRGLGSKTLEDMQTIWCADNRKAALYAAKMKRKLIGKPCKGEEVAEQYLLGTTIGISGTPSLVLPNGLLYPGYISAKKLVKLLNKID